MTFKLTEGQEQFFRTVLMYISNERKSALIQFLDSRSAKSATEIIHEFENEFGGNLSNLGPERLSRGNINGIFDEALFPLELAVLDQVPSEKYGRVRGFRLTKKGEEAKKYAGYALKVMASFFDQSIYPILGTMNSTAEKVRPYEAVRLLYLLEEGPTNLERLVAETSPSYRPDLLKILDDLLYYKTADGEPIPLVDIKKQKLVHGHRGYQWVEGSKMPMVAERSRKLVEVLSSTPHKVWTMHELAPECGYTFNRYGLATSLNTDLRDLESKGNVTSGTGYQLRSVQTTFYGKLLTSSLFDVIRGAIAGDPVSIGIIERNQPSPAEVVRVLGYYAAMKDRERTGEPVLQQMQGKQK